jgi:Ca2+-binding EF-hand superfamily protein
VLTTYGEKLSDDEFDELIRETTLDADGNVNYMEFFKYLVSK